MSYQSGMDAFKAGNYQEAADAFRECVESDEDNHKAWNSLGVVYTKTGHYEAADTCYENALSLSPGAAAYERNREKNKAKMMEPVEDVLNVEDDEPTTKPVKQPISSKRVQYEPIGDRFSNKLAIILAVIGFLFAVVIAGLVMLVGGIGSVLGSSGAESLIGRAWVVVILAFIGVIASVVRHKQYGSIILILSGIFMIILISAGGIIPGALFIISGYLIFREINFDIHYFLDFKTDSIKKGLFTIIILFCLILTIASLGTSGNSVPQKTNIPQVAVSGNTNPQSEIQNQPSNSGAFDFSSVTHASVTSMTKNWDSTAEDDGDVIYPTLLDGEDKPVSWSGAQIPVKIEIWSKKFDSGYKEVKDQLLYSGSATLSNWKDSNLLLGDGIRVPFNEIKQVNDDKYGMVFVTMTLPDARTMEATNSYTALKP